MTLVCQRIGALLCHAPVRDGAAKGKIERFFRTVRESFLTRALDLSSLEALTEHFAILIIHTGNELAELLSAYNASVVRDK